MSTYSNDHELPPAVADNVLENIIEMVGLNESDFLVELIDTYLDDSDETIQKLPEALSAGDLDYVKIKVHSLKTTSETFSAHRLAEMSRSLELAILNDDRSIDLAAGIDSLIIEFTRVRDALADKKRGLLETM